LNVLLTRVGFELLQSSEFASRMAGALQQWMDGIRRPPYLERYGCSICCSCFSTFNHRCITLDTCSGGDRAVCLCFELLLLSCCARWCGATAAHPAPCGL
jgi:hypothetical protein